MGSYKLVTYRATQGARAGVVVDEKLFDMAALTGRSTYATILDVLNDWAAARPILDAALAKAKDGRTRGTPLKQAKLLAPVLYSSAIYCAGANYSDHMAEMARVQNLEPDPDPRSLGFKPWHFIKASRCVIETDSVIRLPTASKKVDWEAELTAVIGQTAKNVPAERALDYVAGYTVANDLSARDLARRDKVRETSPFKYDWVGQKSFDGSCPIGPWIVPAEAIPDPQKLSIKLWVNEVIKQDSNTSQMIFSVAEQIEQLSSRITLYPGDLVLTGTPAGVGAGRQQFLKAGDVVRVWIENIGTLTNTMA